MKNETITIYTPESPLLSLPNFIYGMFRNIWISRGLAWQLTVRDISARYRQSFFGILWAFITPLMATFLFVLLEREGVINQRGTAGSSYLVFVFIGTMLWQVFSDSLTTPLTLITKNKSMLSKLNFPREALLLSALTQILFDFGIKLIGLIFVFVTFGVSIHWWCIPFSLILTIFLILLGFSFGTILTPFGILYTDINIAVRTLLGLWFFVTPAAYIISGNGWYGTLMKINPVSPFLMNARSLLLDGTYNNAYAILGLSGFALFFFFLSLVFFRATMPVLAERMG